LTGTTTHHLPIYLKTFTYQHQGIHTQLYNTKATYLMNIKAMKANYFF